MSFLHVLGDALHIGEAVAPGVVTAINPAAGAVVGLVVQAVTQAEQAGGTGAQKKAAAVQAVAPAAVGAVNAILQAKGSSAAVDPAQVSTAVGSLVDGVVGLLNSVQPSGTPATPSGTGTAATAS